MFILNSGFYLGCRPPTTDHCLPSAVGGLGFSKQKNPDAGSGLDEVKYGYLLFSHRYTHINLPTMRGVNMMMVVLERGLDHVGRYSMTRRGMSQGIVLDNYFCFVIRFLIRLGISQNFKVPLHAIGLDNFLGRAKTNPTFPFTCQVELDFSTQSTISTVPTIALRTISS